MRIVIDTEKRIAIEPVESAITPHTPVFFNKSIVNVEIQFVNALGQPYAPDAVGGVVEFYLGRAADPVSSHLNLMHSGAPNYIYSIVLDTTASNLDTDRYLGASVKKFSVNAVMEARHTYVGGGAITNLCLSPCRIINPVMGWS